MLSTSIFSRNQLITLLILVLLIGSSVAIAATRIQSGGEDQVHEGPTNPHHIPDSMNPKLRRASDEIVVIKTEITEEITEAKEAAETMHSLAFQHQHAYSQPILDYTTGTSN